MRVLRNAGAVTAPAAGKPQHWVEELRVETLRVETLSIGTTVVAPPPEHSKA